MGQQMTDEILKFIDVKIRQQQEENAHYGLDIMDGIGVFMALRVAVEQLHELRKSHPDTIDGWEISLIERKIAAILGVEDGV